MRIQDDWIERWVEPGSVGCGTANHTPFRDIRLTLNGMHHGSDEEEEKNCIERVAMLVLLGFNVARLVMVLMGQR